MKPPRFQYLAPRSLEQAIALLDEHGPDARILAGGQSLVPMLNFRLLAPKVLMDINRLPSMDLIDAHDDVLSFGALVRHRIVETSTLVSERVPVLSAAMRHVAHLAIRNRGTIAGSLCHADPAAELPAIAVLTEAQIRVVGPEGRRTIDAQTFFEGPLSTSLNADELVHGVDIPVTDGFAGWGFDEVARRSGDFAIAGAGALVATDSSGVRDVRICVFGVGDTPMRAKTAEDLLRNSRFEPEAIDAASEAVMAMLNPYDDLHGSADYRRHLAGGLTRRVCRAAWHRSQGQPDTSLRLK
ncbi:MAG: CO/xanthine dehydrogenase FAD-binding subunit [Gammaproteobacteria bacterium]|jgi:CO/xanthine dehydrogenase FAD-binding subunit